MTQQAQRTIVLFFAIAVAGFVHGTRITAPPVLAEASLAGQIESSGTRGRFWRPAGSVAERPALEFEERVWYPPTGERRELAMVERHR
jgi:hypothetical protein